MRATMTKEELAAFAHRLWATCGFRSGLSGNEVQHCTSSAPIIEMLGSLPDGQIVIQGLVRWAWSGYPTLLLGHRYAAALLATETPMAHVRAVEPPWDGFMIDVPNELLWINDPDPAVNRDVEIRRIIACRVPHENTTAPRWAWIAITESSVTMWRYGVTAEQLLPGNLDGNAWEGSPLMLDTTDQDVRTSALVGRLILNVCLAVQDPDLVRETGPGHEAFRRAAHTGNHHRPVPRIFRVGKGIQIDLRQAVHAFLRSGKRLQTEQVVTGHWKLQPYGPKHSKRKLVWIEPYERGPDAAKISGVASTAAS